MTKSAYKKLNITITCVVIVVIAGSLLFAKIFHPVVVEGNSMSPTYKSGDMLKSIPIAENVILQRDDVCVLRSGKINLIKRVVAIPGDTVQIIGGTLYINGKEKDTGNIKDAGCAKDKIVLQENEYFVLGDNPNHSSDSRTFGPVKGNLFRYKIVGKIF